MHKEKEERKKEGIKERKKERKKEGEQNRNFYVCLSQLLNELAKL